LQDEITGTENGTNVVFLQTTVDAGDHFNYHRLDAQVALARPEPIASRNYHKFSQREVERF
jgi:hypothetical protein